MKRKPQIRYGILGRALAMGTTLKELQVCHAASR